MLPPPNILFFGDFIVMVLYGNEKPTNMVIVFFRNPKQIHTHFFETPFKQILHIYFRGKVFFRVSFAECKLQTTKTANPVRLELA